MASNRSPPYDMPGRQTIPLQDLSRPPDSGIQEPNESQELQELGQRVRRSTIRHSRFTGSLETGYERLRDGSPSATEHLSHVTTPQNAYHAPSIFDDDITGAATFQPVVSNHAGISLENNAQLDTPDSFQTPRGRRQESHMAGERSAHRPSFSRTGTSLTSTSDPNKEPFRALDDDRIPLSDPRYLQPISGFKPHTSPERSPRPSLGHDLPHLELGRSERLSSRASARSLSPKPPSSALQRAGTMMRKISQRVVNLSNEPDPIEAAQKLDQGGPRMHEPPALPAMEDYAHDDTREFPPREKPLGNSSDNPKTDKAHRPNPLRGKTLGIFGPDNWLRQKLCNMLVHPVTEPFILVMIVAQTILLTIEAIPSVPYGIRPGFWKHGWLDLGLLILFSFYTLEVFARCIVSGFIKNAKEYSTVETTQGVKAAFKERYRKVVSPNHQQVSSRRGSRSEPMPSIFKTFTQSQMATSTDPRQVRATRLARRAYLRHSFNRLDFVAVTSYWIAFIVTILVTNADQNLYIFRMLSCLRVLRLLGLTSGTSVILRSLKKAAPLLINVAFLIGFFWLLFAIIGIQAFASSFKRSCVWYEDLGQALVGNQTVERYAQNQAPENFQPCGGQYDMNSNVATGWRRANLLDEGASVPKGYLCPQGSFCVENQNPYNNTVSFDNIFQSLQLVFVVMSANTFSDLMYYSMGSDYLAAALFYAGGIIVMYFWLANLLVAVITSSFQVIREESKKSAFMAEEEPSALSHDTSETQRPGSLKKAYHRTYWFWILIILFDLLVMCTRTAGMHRDRLDFITWTETAVTALLVIEILFRIISDWRNFHKRYQNWVDLSLAIITLVMQLPAIQNSGQIYAWLTFFQIVRIYRVVLAISITRDLILKVLGNVTGLLNLIVFVILITFLTALFAVQLFQGEYPPFDNAGKPIYITFSNIFNAFIGMYQIFSSENWTIIMYNATQYNAAFQFGWIGAIFFIAWFILANFIILNMFIAVIQENFDVSEDEKRLQQVKAFLQQKELGGASHGNLSLSTIFKFGLDKGRTRDPLDYGPASMELLLQDAVFRDFLDEHMEPLSLPNDDSDIIECTSDPTQRRGILGALYGVKDRWKNKVPNPFHSRVAPVRKREALDVRSRAREVITLTERRKLDQRQYIRDNPRYNVSLYIFEPSHPIRRFCQRIVGPGRGGERIEGVEPFRLVWFGFSAFIYIAIVVMVVLACITTPLYQREYFREHGDGIMTWYLWTDIGFAALFSVEALIKIVADGFFWTPHAYLRGSWGFIDGVVLVTLWINVITSIKSEGAISRAVGAFKALRALRLLNVSDSARDTFHSVIVLGGWKVASAAFVSLSLLFPFAIYGLNLFNGLMLTCNDGSIATLIECNGEFYGSPYTWNVLAPRVVANPYYSFDNFAGSLSILFQIVSQEGWTDVMWSAMSITSRGQAPQPLQSQGNAVFFIVFNLLGAVFVLTLFVSVFMRNYTEQTGVAFLTAEQRSWLELRKLLRQLSPTKRPGTQAKTGIRGWCYRIAIKKHGKWSRTLTCLLLLHTALLAAEYASEPYIWLRFRDLVFLLLTLFYIANIIIRITGLTWTRFRASSWDLYSLFAVLGTLVSTMLQISALNNDTFLQIHKFFLVSIAFLLIPRNSQLDQLFKTAAGSLGAIGNLLATWFVLFLVFAIAMTQTLGLTRFGSNENGNINFRNVPKALILLFRMSCGEGWNQIMEDFATIEYPYCNASTQFFDSDCGSATWARSLFIGWNILSMYIFVSLFVSLIFESFSYVYQRSSGLAAVTREEIRRFKQAWATFDPDGTGFISSENFPHLLSELSGIFEMRIYSGGDHSVGRILDACRVDPHGPISSSSSIVHGVDLAELNRQLRMIDVDDVRRRRRRMELFYQEIMASAHPVRGVNFTSCLMILAHYNVITDSKSLRLEEYLRRRARLQRVIEEVRRNIVRGIFDTMYWRRKFGARHDFRKSACVTEVPQFEVPEIFVEDEDAEPLAAPNEANWRSGPMEDMPASAFSTTFDTPPLGRTSIDSTGLHRRDWSRGNSIDRVDANEPWLHSRTSVSHEHGSTSLHPVGWTIDTVIPGASLSPRQSPGQWHQHETPLHSPNPSIHSTTMDFGLGIGRDSTTADLDGTSEFGAGTRGHSRNHSVTGSVVDRQNVIESFDSSAWGESMRRSVTIRRTGKGKGQRDMSRDSFHDG